MNTLNHGLSLKVVQYTQVVRDLVRGGKLDVSKGFNARITYHDPCILGRWNREFDAPSEILSSIAGFDLVEMERNRERGFCCGGGGGNFYTDLLSVKNGIALERMGSSGDRRRSDGGCVSHLENYACRCNQTTRTRREA